jgi:anti-anti-sigma factor
MTQPKMSVTKAGTHTVVSLLESITYQNCADIEARLQAVIGRNQIALILECKEVGYLDSTALEMLLRMQDVLRERGCQMKIVSMNPVCRDILLATRLINQFYVYPNVQEAIRGTS